MTRPLRRSLALGALLAVLPTPSHAAELPRSELPRSELTAPHPGPALASPPQRAASPILRTSSHRSRPRHDLRVPTSGDTIRALVVFVRFADDDRDNDRPGADDGFPNHWPAYGPDGRLLPRERLPAWGHRYVVSDPADIRAERLSPMDSSLSAYFYWQSKNGPSGPFVLAGDVWPRDAAGTPIVHVTRHPEARYYADPRTDRETGRQAGWGWLTQEVLDRLVAQPGFDIGDYDHDGDGVLDHLFVLVRTVSPEAVPEGLPAPTGGWAALNGVPSFRATYGNPPGRELAYESPTRGTVRVLWGRSGSQSIIGRGPGRLLVTHELGHQYFRMGHTPTITDNDVPLVVPPPGQTGHHPCLYSRMCGKSGGRRSNYDTNPSLGGWELRRMGWADREVLRPESGDRSVEIAPLYTSGRVVLIPLAPGSAGDTLSVESRQATNGFDRRRDVRIRDPYYGTIREGLLSTGLLVTLGQGRGRGGSARYDYLPPDNDHEFRVDSTGAAPRWDGVTPCDGTSPGCAGLDAFEDDTYAPGGATQITPWTRPNVSGYTRYPDGRAPNWFALDRIRYTGDADSTMAFDFVADVRRAAETVVRRDAWMGRESDGLTLQSLRVEPGATLHVGEGAVVTFAGRVRVAAGGALEVEPGAQVRFRPGARFVREGAVRASSRSLGPTAPALRSGPPRRPGGAR